jgi:hypothetical protein
MKLLISVLIGAALVACTSTTDKPAIDMDEVAREYLFIELSMGLHDSNHVDAYYGPEEIRDEATRAALTIDEVEARARALSDRLAGLDGKNLQLANPERVAGLLARLRALLTRIAINRGEYLSFDEESLALFGAVAPDVDVADYDDVLARIDAVLPGEGALAERVNAFRDRFSAPADKVPALLETAVAECRRRTVAHVELPANESFRLEYVSNKPWGAYNWYQGDAHSLIELNLDAGHRVSSFIGTGCHEGYPGHHMYNVLLEENLVRGRGWLEFTLYPLFSPESLIAEGSANYGTRLAFPGDELAIFTREVLFPLAGLNPQDAERYEALRSLSRELAFVGNEIARDYLDGRIDRDEAIALKMKYELSTRERAERSVWFVETYRSYVINYNLGEKLITEYIEKNATSEAERWQKFVELLSAPPGPEHLL